LTDASQAEAALYTELDKLSAAWETLDRQVKSKVFDLRAAEDRTAKLSVEVCTSVQNAV
jgi:E3 ubiquitin-protein ligase BRE1